MSNIQIIRTDAGWHVSINGDNGEPIVTSEVYPEPDGKRTAVQAINSVGRIIDNAVAATGSQFNLGMQATIVEEIDRRSEK